MLQLIPNFAPSQKTSGELMEPGIQFATAAQVAAELTARTQAVAGTATQFGSIAGAEKYPARHLMPAQTVR